MTTAPHPIRQPNLSLRKEPAETTPAPVEGTVVKHQGEIVKTNDASWMRSKVAAVGAVKDHAVSNKLYAPWVGRGYKNLARRWVDGFRDDYPQMIRSAKDELKAAKGDTDAEAHAKKTIKDLRTDRREHQKWHAIKSCLWGAAGVAGAATGAVVGGTLIEAAMGAGAYIVGAYHGRPEPEIAAIPELRHQEAPREASLLGEETMRRVLVEAGVVPEKRAEEIRGIGIPRAEGPGTGYTVDLPSGIPASDAIAKAEKIASALGVHKDWTDLAVDRGKGSNASRLKVWMSSEDPFDVVRRSPLLDHSGVINTWRDGAPLVFGKRGNTIWFRIRETSFLVGGATRRGKGVLLANLLLATAKDPRVNVRIFDGKGTGEHNPFAPLLSTFVKKNPERLALASRALIEDMDRRADFLDEHGLDKLTEDLIEQIGGVELFVVDELATYTPKGTSPFADEITENLSQLAAVGLALGIILVDLTQVPEVDVIRGRLRQNHTGRAAMNTESAMASNTILGDGMAGAGHDASKIPLDQPGRTVLATPDTGVVAARSFMVEPEEKRVVAAEAIEIRREAGRLPGQWQDPIEAKLLAWTGVSSAAGGERGNGRITRVDLLERLEILAKSTGRGNVTNAEVFAAFAATDPARYGRKDGETDAGWAGRVGKVIRDQIEAAGVELEVKRVPAADGKRGQGYLLEDITAARNG
ncbi:FtsK/SpoIIIE domain-containing protein [Streptomyces sp. NPDC097640]|uniref:FtsK/SpoIIIE domain-containing protein n=1 Tax=Streptomyces sp. NPDC097640 TaxID=3157229 RepID=UPI00331E7811